MSTLRWHITVNLYCSMLTPKPMGFTQYIFRQSIPENSWHCIPFSCGCPCEKINIKNLVLPSLRALWNIGPKTAHWREGKEKFVLVLRRKENILAGGTEGWNIGFKLKTLEWKLNLVLNHKCRQTREKWVKISRNMPLIHNTLYTYYIINIKILHSIWK